ncbi:MAG: molybdopterin molybdotransferase MoeA [Parvibaculaceae bacterium]
MTVSRSDDGQPLRHADALALLKLHVKPCPTEEAVPLFAAGGRIASRAVHAAGAVPGAANSAVDGYAFAFRHYDPAQGASLPVAGRAAAGHPATRPMSGGAISARIFTGALLPEGCDTVAMQEDIRLLERHGATHVVLPAGLRPGANVRPAGEDVAPGVLVVTAGQLLRPQDLAQLASIGVQDVWCHRRLSVALASTGDEVVRGAAALDSGQIHDANGPMLRAIVEAAGCDVVDLGVLPDEPEALKSVLGEAASRHAAIVTSGGVSRGEEDHLAGVLGDLGRQFLWQVAVKPGRSLIFGEIGDCLMIGLPGNPVAVFVSALIYARSALARLGGATWPEPRRYPLRAAFEFRGRKTGRREFWRGILADTPEGLAVDKFRRDGSGLISGLRASDGLIDIPEEQGDVRVGDPVHFIPYTEFGLPPRI